jgi:hypothetical protein
MKTCTKCHAAKDVGEFYKKQSRCKGCMALATAAWAKTPEGLAWHRENQRAQRATPNGKAKRRARALKSTFGLIDGQYETMLAAQGGRCANPGCQTEVPGGKGAFHVDHDHVTGAVRGLLCNTCNVALGMLGDGLRPNRAYGLFQYQLRNAA